MPILSVFTDVQCISLLLYKSKTEQWVENFPYVYAKSIFSASYDETAFYKSLLTSFCLKHGVNFEECDLLMSGFMEAPRVNLKTKLSLSLFDLFSKIQTSFPVLVNHSSLLSRSFSYSISSVKNFSQQLEQVENAEENFYANLDIYPQIRPVELSTQIDIDTNIGVLTSKQTQFPTDTQINFCGARFATASFFPELDYLLILNLFKNSGTYDISRNFFNSNLLKSLVTLYEPKIELEDKYSESALVVTSSYSLECLVETDDGASQLVQLDRDKVFVLPTVKGERLKVKAKAHDLPAVEKSFVSGSLGIVFDTRTTKKISVESIKVFTAGLKSFVGVGKV